MSYPNQWSIEKRLAEKRIVWLANLSYLLKDHRPEEFEGELEAFRNTYGRENVFTDAPYSQSKGETIFSPAGSPGALIGVYASAVAFNAHAALIASS